MSSKQRNQKGHHKQNQRKQSRVPQLLAVGGIAFVLIALLILKYQPKDAISTPTPITVVAASAIPEEQLNTALAEKRPTLGFYHSNNCHNCIIMMDMIEKVFPEYAGTVTLVDVDVYDERNRSLLRRERIQYIPTMIFYGSSGEVEIMVGPMEETDLRQMLAALGEEG